jgi:hypothetical protein
MNNRGMTLLSGAIALSLGALATPIGLSGIGSHQASINPDRGVIYQQYAQEEEHHEVKEKVDQKVDEMHDMGTGAGQAVKNTHEEHEATESMHHGLTDKTESKVKEMHDEAVGAGNAVKETHEEHERSEEHQN